MKQHKTDFQIGKQEQRYLAPGNGRGWKRLDAKNFRPGESAPKSAERNDTGKREFVRKNFEISDLQLWYQTLRPS